MKDLKALNNEVDNGLKILSGAVKGNKQDGSHVLYNLKTFLIEKGYMKDDIYIAFYSILDANDINDANGMIEDLLNNCEFEELDDVKDATIDKLLRQSETLRDAYSGGIEPYLHFNTKDLFVEYVSIMRAYLILQDFKKAILKLEREANYEEDYEVSLSSQELRTLASAIMTDEDFNGAITCSNLETFIDILKENDFETAMENFFD